MRRNVRLSIIIAGVMAIMVFACKPPKPTPAPEATLTPTAALEPTPTPAEVPVYPGAELLDMFPLVKWNEIAPWRFVGDPEEFLQHWAWRTEDLAQKVTAGYDEIMYNPKC